VSFDSTVTVLALNQLSYTTVNSHQVVVVVVCVCVCNCNKCNV